MLSGMLIMYRSVLPYMYHLIISNEKGIYDITCLYIRVTN